MKNYNGTTAEVQATNSSTTAYTRSALTFTTGASNTTATIYAWFNRTDGTAYSYVDDFFLCEPLPAPWAKSDIGTVPFAGDSGARNGQTVIRSGGADIWNAADSMHFVWQALPGSGTITARLRTLENTSGVCKVGVMLRESLLPGAKDIYIGWRGDGKIERIRRNTADTACTSNVGAVMTAPWVKIRRDGDVLTTFYSPDGVTWTAHGSTQTIPMATTVYVGLAASSNDATLVGESSADNVTFQADDYDQDGMPDTWEMAAFGSLTQTANGDSDGDGMTNLQEFLAGTNPTDAASRLTATLSRPSAAAPFTLTWPSVPGKTYTLLYQAALGGAWQTLTTVPAAVAPATSTSYSDATSAGLTQRFYKVQVGP